MKKFSFDHVVLSPKDQIGLHKQSSWELSYIIRGEGLRTIGDRTERFQSGEIALVVPEMPHQWKFDMPSDGEDALIENITITFSPILLTKLSNTFDEMAALSLWFNGLEESIILPKEANREMRNVMHKMIKQDDCERLVALFRLLVMIWKSDGKHSFGQFQTDRDTDIVNKVISYLHCNFKRPVTIQQLAAYTGMNGTSLCSLFKRKKQKTIMQYLLDYRMKMVKEGLRRGGSSISQVCYECGFRDVPYFNRTFKKYMSMTPKEYKQLGAEERDEEGDAEVHDEAMEDGEGGKILTAVARDDRQRGVHRCRAAHADRCQRAEPTDEERRAEQRQQLPHNVGKERHRTEGRATILRDEDA